MYLQLQLMYLQRELMNRWPAVGWLVLWPHHQGQHGRPLQDRREACQFLRLLRDRRKRVTPCARAQRLWTLRHVGLARWLCESVCESGHWVSGGTKAFLGVPSFLIPSGHSVAMVF